MVFRIGKKRSIDWLYKISGKMPDRVTQTIRQEQVGFKPEISNEYSQRIIRIIILDTYTHSYSF